MYNLALNRDQMVKQEQYKDLLREAEHYRLIRSAAQPAPGYLIEVADALHSALVALSQRLPNFRPTRHARV